MTLYESIMSCYLSENEVINPMTFCYLSENKGVQPVAKKDETTSPTSADVHLPSGVVTKASNTTRKPVSVYRQRKVSKYAFQLEQSFS